MPRNTVDELKKIYTVHGNRDLTPFLATADLMVTEVLSSHSLSDARLKQIEVYLAAHYATIALDRGGFRKRKMDESEDLYAPIISSAKGMMSTHYGQQAIALDTSGTLANITVSPIKAQFRVM